jgi:quercetin dioxygenase-like cupin family protein
MPKPISPQHGALFDPATLIAEMMREEGYRRAGHTAHTLVLTDDLRVVLLVMKARSTIAEHQVNETAAVHVLSGRIRLELPARVVEVGAGELFVLGAGLRHNVLALEDSAYFLTFGWTTPPEQPHAEALEA